MAIDLSPPKNATPPRKKAAAKSPDAATPVNTELTESRARGLHDSLQGLSMLAAVGGWHADAGAIGQHAQNIATNFAKIAETNESMAAGIDWVNNSSPYFEVAMAVMPLAMQLAANHSKKFADRFVGTAGVQPPSVIAAEVKTELSRMQAEAARRQADALRAQQEAEEELNRELHFIREAVANDASGD